MYICMPAGSNAIPPVASLDISYATAWKANISKNPYISIKFWILNISIGINRTSVKSLSISIWRIKQYFLVFTYWSIMLWCLQVRTLFLQWLPWILRMQRPGKPITRKTIMMTNRMRELELKEKTSKSLLANVLDMDDDFRLVSPFSFNKASISESELRPTPCSDF